MHIVIIILLAVISAALLTRFFLRKRKSMEICNPDLTLPPYERLLLTNIRTCGPVVDTALECISTSDGLTACRNHYLGSKSIARVGKLTEKYSYVSNEIGNCKVYHEYMLDSAEKIAEIARRITTSPTFAALSRYSKCEVENIRISLSEMMTAVEAAILTGNHTDDVIAKIRRDKDFIEHTITTHSKSMSYKDFDEEAGAYSYLMLLYYLQSFVNSLLHIINPIEVTNHHIITA